MRSATVVSDLFARLRWELQRGWAALGVAELLAVALLLLWGGLHWQVSRPLAALAAAQDERLQTLQAAQHALRPGAGGQAPASPMEVLPPESARDAQLILLHKLAERQQLLLKRVAYRAEPVPALPLQRLSVSLVLQGSYVAQRQFLHALLEAAPNLAVEQLALEKGDAPGDGMSMQLQAALYYRQGSTAP